jgi:serine protease Do
MRDLPRLVADTVPDKAVDVVVVRKGKEMTLQVKVGRLEESEKTAEKKTEEPAPEPTKSLSALGLSLSDLTEEAREQYKIDKQVSGVVVTDVEDGSAAAEKQIAAGEVIVEVNQEQVRTPQDVLDRIEVLKKAGRKSVLLTLAKPDGELRFVPVRVDG